MNARELSKALEISMPLWLRQDPGVRRRQLAAMLPSATQLGLREVIDQATLIGLLEPEADEVQYRVIEAIQATANGFGDHGEVGLRKELKKVLPLRNGGEMVAGRGLQCLTLLQNLLNDERLHFDALLALSRSNSQDIDSQSIKYLQLVGCVRSDGTLFDDIRAVLQSSYQETSEGPILTTPFKFAEPREARALEVAKEEELQEFMRDVLEKKKKRDEGRSP